jgi:hypothetical protein
MTLIFPLGGDLLVGMLDALATGLDTSQLTAQVEFQGAAHCARRARHGLDAELLKESDGPPAHPASEHHVHALAVDEIGHHPGRVLAVVGVVNDVDSLDLMTLHIHKDVMRATPKVRADHAFEAIPIVSRDGEPHGLALLPFVWAQAGLQFLEPLHDLGQLLAQVAGCLFQGCDFLFTLS